MGESKRRKKLDLNYGKSRTIQKDAVYYVSTADTESVIFTLRKWQNSISQTPKILLKTHKNFLSSRFSVNNQVTASKLPISTYAHLVLNVYGEFEKFIQKKKNSNLDIRLLKDRNENIYSIIAITKAKSMPNSKSTLLRDEMPWIEFLVVNPLLLNQGIGTLTFQYLISELGSKIASQIYVDSAGFFEKQGFSLEIDIPNNDADFYVAQNLSSNLSIVRRELFHQYRNEIVYRTLEVVHSSNVNSDMSIKIIEKEYPKLLLRTSVPVSSIPTTQINRDLDISLDSTPTPHLSMLLNVLKNRMFNLLLLPTVKN